MVLPQIFKGYNAFNFLNDEKFFLKSRKLKVTARAILNSDTAI